MLQIWALDGIREIVAGDDQPRFTELFADQRREGGLGHIPQAGAAKFLLHEQIVHGLKRDHPLSDGTDKIRR